MSFWRDEEKAETRPQNWRQESGKGAPRPQDDGTSVPRGTTNWPQTSARPPAVYQSERDNQHPAEEPDYGTVEDSGGSGKVIPDKSDSNFENKKDRAFRFATHRLKQAIRMNQIRQFVSDPVRQRAKDYTPVLKRVNKRNMIWTFQVGKWLVKVKADFKHPRMTKFDKADLHLTCSCPFWRWQGPEHWGTQDDYQQGKPRGTASFPIIRDPSHEKAVCKHVYAVFEKLESMVFIRRKTGASQIGRVSVSYEGLERMARSIVRRYLRGETDADL